MKLADFLIKRKQEKKAAIVEGNKEISYTELYDRSSALSCIIQKQLKQRAHIAILLPNSIAYVLAYCSILLSGSVIVPIYYKSTTNEIENSVNYCDVSMIITDSDGEKRVIDSKLNHNVSVLNVHTLKLKSIGKLDTQATIHSPDCVSIMLGTSGSTGSPKRVMLSDSNMIENALGIIQSLKYQEDERLLVALPMTFASGNTSQLVVSLILGATLCLYQAPLHPKLFFESVKEYGATTTTIVPSVLKTLLADDRDYSEHAKTLRVICFGGGPTDSGTFQKLLASPLRDKFVHMYGQMEASTRISHLHISKDKDKIPSVGQPLYNITVSVDITDPATNTGEIYVKGDNVMVGYYKERNSPVSNGWLATGDIGYVDVHDYIYITGRKKNIIIFSGMNIQPEEVEDVLCQNSEVAEALVYGEHDPQYGEVPVAEIVLKEPGAITDAQLRCFCSEKLSHHKVPVRIYFVDALQRTFNGKVARKRSESYA